MEDDNTQQYCYACGQPIDQDDIPKEEFWAPNYGYASAKPVEKPVEKPEETWVVSYSYEGSDGLKRVRVRFSSEIKARNFVEFLMTLKSTRSDTVSVTKSEKAE